MIVQTFWLGVTIVLITLCEAKYDMDKLCQLVPAETKLASFSSPQIYFTCLSAGGSVKSTCPDDDVFDKNTQTCVATSQETSNFSNESNPCQNKNNTFVANSRGCNWYSYCLNGEIFSNDTCKFGEIFYPQNGTCINGICGDSVNNLFEICKIMPNELYFGDFENCHDWHICSGGKPQNGVCSDSLVFDTASGYCLPNDGNICKRVGTELQSEASGPPQQGCSLEGQMVADTNVCSIYYMCQKKYPKNVLEWVQLKCHHQYFDVITEQCRSLKSARVYPSCNRCQYVFNRWTNAVDPSCQSYLTCQNGHHVGTTIKSCENGYFFDETVQACAEDKQLLEQYEMLVGACQNYQCNDLRVCSASS